MQNVKNDLKKRYYDDMMENRGTGVIAVLALDGCETVEKYRAD